MSHIIGHIDGDSFFASVEQSINPSLKGRPVITGAERGIASSMSKEAKVLGVTRGMPVTQIRRLFPEVIVVHSDFFLYTVFSRRMFDIARRYGEEIEEYSIDEFFIRFKKGKLFSERKVKSAVFNIKSDIKKELGITVSVGLASTKVLAKIASNWGKPDGFTFLKDQDRENYLKATPLNKVWGIGERTAEKLEKVGLRNAFDLVSEDFRRIQKDFYKPLQTIWQELNGQEVFPFGNENLSPRKSIRSSRTFIPSANKDFLLKEIVEHIEKATFDLRRMNLRAKCMSVFIKTQTFKYKEKEVKFFQPSNASNIAVVQARIILDGIFLSGVLYRTTGVIFSGLENRESTQQVLFNERHQEISLPFKVIDNLNLRFGRGVVGLCSGLKKSSDYKKEFRKSRFSIPSFGEVD